MYVYVYVCIQLYWMLVCDSFDIVPLYSTLQHSVCIMHQVSKKLQIKCEITVTVDGERVGSAVVKAPGLAEVWHTLINLRSYCVLSCGPVEEPQALLCGFVSWSAGDHSGPSLVSHFSGAVFCFRHGGRQRQLWSGTPHFLNPPLLPPSLTASLLFSLPPFLHFLLSSILSLILSCLLFAVDAEQDHTPSLQSAQRLQERTISCSAVDQIWGAPVHLGGLLSSVCVFTDVLSLNSVKTISQFGQCQ